VLRAIEAPPITELRLSRGSGVRDLRGVSRHAHLRTLIDDSGELESLAGIEALTELETFYTTSPVRELEPLRGLVKMRSLHVFSPAVTSIAPLAGMSRLEVADFTRFTPQDLGALRAMTSMKHLAVRGLLDLTVLDDMRELEWLTIRLDASAPPLDVAPLVKHRLTQLDLSEARVASEEPVRRIPTLVRYDAPRVRGERR
jgi:hypothetical protein